MFLYYNGGYYFPERNGSLVPRLKGHDIVLTVPLDIRKTVTLEREVSLPSLDLK